MKRTFRETLINRHFLAQRGGGKRLLSIGVSVLLSISALLTVIPHTEATVYAADLVKTEANTGLGTGSINSDHSDTEGSLKAGQWCYVYYGKQIDGNYVRYRVLDKAATEYGPKTTMLLDCDYLLEKSVFDSDGGNIWKYSDIKIYLNGGFLIRKFDARERAAIAASIKNNASGKDMEDGVNSLKWTPLSNDFIFLLDAREAASEYYGYKNSSNGDSSRVKKKIGNDTDDHYWWLRSEDNNNYEKKAGCVSNGGWISTFDVKSDEDHTGGFPVMHSITYDVCLSPALNLDLSSVIFSSLIDGEAGSAGAEYKLSIKDTDLGADPGIVTGKGNTVTVPYSNVNGDPDQLSVVMTDGTWSDETGWSTGAEMKYYGKLDVNGDIETDGFGTFELPEGFSLADGWNAYLVPENINDDYETDYAGTPAAFTIPKLDPVCDVPAGLTATYGQTLADVALNNPAGNTPGKWTWVDAGTTSVGDAGTNSFKADFIPDDTTNYNSTTNVDVSVSVGKTDSAVTKVPAAKKLTYNGKAQELVTAGEAAGGTMQYALGTNAATAPASGWSASIPTGTDAGTYYVWYKVVGDKNHNDSGAAGPVKAVISAVSIKDAKVVLKSAKIGYNGKDHKPVIKTINGRTLKEGTDYTVSVQNSKGKDVKTYKALGKYTLVIKGKGGYTGTTQAKYEIIKGTNPLNVTAQKKTFKVNYSKLKDKDQIISKGKIFNFKKNGKGKITYTLSSARKGAKSYKKYFAVNNKGNLTIKTGLKKDLYTVKINVKAAGDKNYKAATKAVTFTVKVR